jgi:hypothetical protein
MRFSIPDAAATIADRIVQKRHHDWIEAFFASHRYVCSAIRPSPFGLLGPSPAA